jgi:tetratricopeptide (TPR) repeat protein
LNSTLPHGYLILAYGQLGQNKLQQAAETYQALGKLSPLGAAFRDSGLGDLALYQGRFAEAQRILEASAAHKDGPRWPEIMVALAYTHLVSGRGPQAVQAAESAVSASKKENIRFLAARILLEAGEMDRAKEIGAGLGQELGREPRAYSKLI